MPKTKLGSIYYEVVGEENSMPITLFMGLGLSSRCWPSSFIDGLVKRGFKVVLIDNRDTARSYFDDRYTPDIFDSYKSVFKFLLGINVLSVYTLSDMAEDAVLVLDELGISKTHVLGISLGGMIAQVFSAEHPERTLSLASLSSAIGNRKTGVGSFSLIRKFAQGLKPEEGSSSGVYKLLAGSKYPITDEEEKLYNDLASDRTPEAVRRQIFAILASGNRADSYSKIKVPIFLFHGNEDPLLPVKAAHEMKELNANSELVIVEGMGHQLPNVVVPVLLEHLENFYKRHD